MNPELRALPKMVALLLRNADCRRVVRYVSPKLTVKVTRRCFRRGGRADSTMLLTIGRPNYVERRFIKAAQRAGEPFPVRRLQLQHMPRARR